MKQSTERYVLITGTSEGLGNALMHSLLRQDRTTRVLGVARRSASQVEGLSGLGEQERARYTHLSVDLTDASQRASLVGDVRELLDGQGARLASVALVNGTGFLDTEVAERPELADRMEALNVTAPTEITEGLRNHMEPTAPILYYSGLLTHPNAHVPVVEKHAEVKRKAADRLGRAWPDRFKLVMPGAYRTRMLLDAIVRESAMLEWFAVPLSDPYARGGLSDVVARYALRAASSVPKTIVRPRLTRLLLTTNTAEQLLESLPGAIRRAARGILAETGQTDAQHDERVRYLKGRRLYGDKFPYDSILSSRLWSAGMSSFYASSLRAVRLVD